MNKTVRIAAFALLALALSNSAVAQMGGRGPGQGGTGPGAGAGPGNGPGNGPGPGGDIRPIVAPDGKALLVKRTSTTSGSTTTTTVQLVAVSTAGTVAWTWTPPADLRGIALPTGLVAVTAVTQSSTAAPTSQVIALNLASGAQVWATSFDGLVGDLQETSTGLLGVVSKYVAPSGSETHGTMTRSLVSINLAGSIVWTLALD
jgi:hypothetical protein